MTTISKQDSNTQVAPELPDGCSRANQDDVWLRHIIESKAARVEEPRLKAQYIQRKLEIVEDRPWKAEISGRLLSIAHDVEQKALEAAAAAASDSIKFRHVTSVQVATIRQNKSLDVIHEPKSDDPAHANIVAYDIPMAPLLNDLAVPKISQEFIKKLCDSFRVDDSDKLSPLINIRSSVLERIKSSLEAAKDAPLSVSPHSQSDPVGPPSQATE